MKEFQPNEKVRLKVTMSDRPYRVRHLNAEVVKVAGTRVAIHILPENGGKPVLKYVKASSLERV